MPNPYHDADGKFCSRNQMQDAIDLAGRSGDFDTFTRLKDDLNTIDAASPEEIYASFSAKAEAQYVTGPKAKPASRIKAMLDNHSGTGLTYRELGALSASEPEVKIDGTAYKFIQTQEVENERFNNERSRELVFQVGDGFYRTSYQYDAWEQDYTIPDENVEQVQYGPVQTASYDIDRNSRAQHAATYYSRVGDAYFWNKIGNGEVGDSVVSEFGDDLTIVSTEDTSVYHGVIFGNEDDLYRVRFPLDSWDDGQYDERYVVQPIQKKRNNHKRLDPFERK